MKSKISRRVLFFAVLGTLAVEWACAPAPQLFNRGNTNPTYEAYKRQSLFPPIPDQYQQSKPVPHRPVPIERTAKPVEIKSGQYYYETPTQNQNRVEKGICSWSGVEQHGTQMANGEIFNMYHMVAAHRSLAFGSVVKVTNMQNGRSVTVQIKDRGPFVNGRIIDVSFAAAQKLDMVNAGIVPAQVELLRGEYVEETKPQSDFLEKAKELYDGLIDKIFNKIGNQD